MNTHIYCGGKEIVETPEGYLNLPRYALLGGTIKRITKALNEWHEAHRQQFVQDGYTNLLDTFDTQEQKHAHFGGKYVRFDVGGSGAWMMDLMNGIIYGIKGYGKVDKKKIVGRLGDDNFNGAVLHRDRFRHGRFDNGKS